MANGRDLGYPCPINTSMYSFQLDKSILQFMEQWGMRIKHINSYYLSYNRIAKVIELVQKAPP